MSAPVAAAVRLELLRAGRSDEALFLVPGLEGDPEELADLAAAITGPQAVYAVAPTAASEPAWPRWPPAWWTRFAACRRPGRTGSAGTRSAGWPRSRWPSSCGRRGRRSSRSSSSTRCSTSGTGRGVPGCGRWSGARAGSSCASSGCHPLRAAAEFRRRGVRLLQRFQRRNTDAADTLRANEQDLPSVTTNAFAALSGYRPEYYNGDITLIASAEDRHFGCDTGKLWEGYARQLDVQRIAGDHLTVMQRPDAAAVIAHLIDHRLATARPDWPGLRPVPDFVRPMIVSTMRWFSAARLAHALGEAGYEVSACRPANHPIDVLGPLTADHRLRRGRRLASLEAAIRETRPDLLLPDDERAWALIRRLHDHTSDPETQALIQKSLGHLDDWGRISSRTAVAQEARRAGVAVPDTEVVAAAGGSRRLDLPADAEDRRQLGRPRRGPRAGREPARADVGEHLEPAVVPPGAQAPGRQPRRGHARRPAAGRRPVVNAQQHLSGRDAVVTVACQDGWCGS
jgi:hypothetical protein